MNEVQEDGPGDEKPWVRILFMLLFVFIYSIAEIVLGAVVILQILFTLLNRKTNENLLVFGKQLSVFIYQVFLFLTYNTEKRPFPFDDFPEAEVPSDGNDNYN